MGTEDCIKLTRTEEVIVGMLRENTGCHMLDSGSLYGRHWQKNQTRNFLDEPSATLRFSIYGKSNWNIEYTRNIFHFLTRNLVYNQPLTDEFNGFMADKDYSDLTGMEDFCELNGFKYFTCNTYNESCNLDQTLQFTSFGDSDSYSHVLLQIHGGCDVRGGYTSPIVFDLLDEYSLFGLADGTIVCPECKKYWTTDDNSHWYDEGSCGLGAGTELNNYDACEGSTGEMGKIVITPNGEGFCPHCGKGILITSEI